MGKAAPIPVSGRSTAAGGREGGGDPWRRRQFHSAATCSKIIGPLSGIGPGDSLLDFTRMTGDLVRAIRKLPAADRPPKTVRGRVRGRQRDQGHGGSDIRFGQAGLQDGVPVLSRVGLFLGCVRNMCRGSSATAAGARGFSPGAP